MRKSTHYAAWKPEPQIVMRAPYKNTRDPYMQLGVRSLMDLSTHLLQTMINSRSFIGIFGMISSFTLACSDTTGSGGTGATGAGTANGGSANAGTASMLGGSSS